MAEKHRFFRVAFLALLLSACSESDADRVDKQLAVLCASDAGLKVFEKIEVSREDYGKYTYIPWYYDGSEGYYFISTLNSNVKFHLKNESGYIIRPVGPPNQVSLSQEVHKIIRATDRKVMAVHIDYSRSGGISSFMSAYSKNCGILAYHLAFTKDVFYIGGQK